MPPSSHRVVLRPSGWSFAAAVDRAVLPAAAEAGIRLPAACRNGTCRACMCRLLAGEVDYGAARPGLSPDERAGRWVLPCIARPRSDLELDVPGATEKEVRPPPGMLTGARR